MGLGLSRGDKQTPDPNTAPIMTLVDFCNTVQPFDALYFSGSDALSTMMIIGTRCKWTHVGIIDVCPTSGARFVWESQNKTDGCVDILSRSSSKIGVRLIDLYERLVLYANANQSPLVTPAEARVLGLEGTVGWRLLPMAVMQFRCPSPQKRAEMQVLLTGFQNSEIHKTFEQSKMTMLRAEYGDMLGSNQRDTREYFCSELAVQTYIAIGALPTTVVSSQYSPKTLCLEPQRLPWQNGCRLGPELNVVRVLVPPIPPHMKET